MIAIIQRVSSARVIVAGATVGQIGPGLLALVAVLLGSIVSSRASDVRVAEGIGGLVVLPVVVGSVGVQLGGVFLTGLHMLLTAVMALFVALVVFVLAIELFEREAILMRWKGGAG
jgi:hypothetical protein